MPRPLKSPDRGRPEGCDFPSIELPPNEAFEAIHRFYLLLEPDLIAAIQRGDLREGRRMINHVLVHIYSIGEERSDFLKFLLLEFVVVLVRRAIEAGGDDRALLQFGHRAFRDLSLIDDDEALSAWLRETLETIFAAFPREKIRPEIVERALDYLRGHLDEDLGREKVAGAVGTSPGHLNDLLKQAIGRPFRDILRDLRVQRACQLLADPRLTLADIATRCGFFDQSHLNRAFQRTRGVTPRRYRAELDSQAD